MKSWAWFGVLLPGWPGFDIRMIEGVAEVSAARGLLSKQRGFSQGDVHNMIVELVIDDGRRVELIDEWEQIVLGWTLSVPFLVWPRAV
jgi:hypothetical protein